MGWKIYGTYLSPWWIVFSNIPLPWERGGSPSSWWRHQRQPRASSCSGSIEGVRGGGGVLLSLDPLEPLLRVHVLAVPAPMRIPVKQCAGFRLFGPSVPTNRNPAHCSLFYTALSFPKCNFSAIRLIFCLDAGMSPTSKLGMIAV